MRPRVLLLLGCFLTVARGSRLMGRHTLQLCDTGYYWYYNMSNNVGVCKPCATPACERLLVNVNMSLDTRVNLSLALQQKNLSLEQVNDLNQIDLEVQDCMPGYYCTPDDPWPIPCPAGTYNPTYRAQTITHCLDCPLHHFCPLASSAERDCPDGHYTNQVNARDASDCQECPPGYYCPRNIPIPCANGTYQPLTGATSANACITCPPAQFCELASTGPQYCKAGTYNALDGATDTTWCIPCPVHTYCTLGSLAPTPCPDGYYRNTTGGVSVMDCWKCPPLHICIVNGSMQMACETGYFLNTQNLCQSCPPGSYCVNNTKQMCPVGYYSHALNSQACNQCQIGTYSAALGATSCPLCQTGSYCDSTGMYPCPNHTTSIAGASSISECTCEAGFTCLFTRQVYVSLVLDVMPSDNLNDLASLAQLLVASVMQVNSQDIQLLKILNVTL